MWIGELITARGIGNGMSILIFISIISRLPGGIAKFFEGSMTLVSQIAFVIIALAVIVGVIWITTGERRIPVQYAKRIVGRRMMGGTSTFIPLKVNMAGVIPVIFAASVMLIPPTIAQFLPGGQTSWFARSFGPTSVAYIIGEALLIILFTYFYTAVTFNPIDQADNLKKYGGFVPGVRPGRPDGRVPRPHPHPAHAPRRAVPRRGGRAAVAALQVRSACPSTSAARPS